MPNDKPGRREETTAASRDPEPPPLRLRGGDASGDLEPPPLRLRGADASEAPPLLPLISVDDAGMRAAPQPSLPPDKDALTQPAVRKPSVAAQLAPPVLAAGLTIYLARALKPASAGIYVLAVAIGAVGLYAGWVGLPLLWAWARSADREPEEAGGTRAPQPSLQLVATAIGGIALLALAGTIAAAYGRPALGWPLRWVALAILGQGVAWLLAEQVDVTRESPIGARLAAAQGVIAVVDTVALVAGGAGVAGAVLGLVPGCMVAAAAGYLLAMPAPTGLGGRSRAGRGHSAARLAGVGALSVADATWAALMLVDVVLVGALVKAPALGRFGVVVLLGSALAGTAASASGALAGRAARRPPASAAERYSARLRFMIVAQGVMVAPMIVWAEPLTHLLFGHAYGSAGGALRALAVFSFVAGPAWLMTRFVTRLDVVRSRLLATSLPIEAGLIATYVLTRSDGIVGAAIALDALVVVYLAVHLKVASSLIDLSRLLRTLGRTALAAIVMAVLLYGAGTRDLSAVGWVTGAIGGVAAFAAVLLVTGEVSLAQLWRRASL